MPDQNSRYLTEEISANKCKICGKYSLVMDNAEIVCNTCGAVAADRIEDPGKEWREFSNDSATRIRAGAPMSLARHDKGLCTIISFSKMDASGNPLNAETINMMRRLRMWDSRSKNKHVEKNLRTAFTELERSCHKLGLGYAVKEKAAYLYRKILEKGFVRGRPIGAMVAACLYAASRDAGATRSLKEIVKVSNRRPKELYLCYKFIVNELDLKVPTMHSLAYVNKIATNVGVGSKTVRKAMEILEQANERMLSGGKHPVGLAATALYYACLITGERKTQKEIAQSSGVTEVTIRNRCKDLRKITCS